MVLRRQVGMCALAAMLVGYGCGSSKKSSKTSADATSSSVTKSSATTTIAGSLSLTASADASLALVDEEASLAIDATISSVSCVDTVDGTVYDANATVAADGTFTCKNVNSCYGAASCTQSTPVQVTIKNNADNSTICLATAGQSGIVCDVAGCFAAAQAALPSDAKVCLQSVNAVAAANVFQSALNSAFQQGQIALDQYTLAQCLALTDKQRLDALNTMTHGSLAAVLINSIDSQFKKQLNRCNAKAGQALDVAGTVRDFLTLGFVVGLSGTAYNAEKGTAGSPAAALEQIKQEVLQVEAAVAQGIDPQTLVTANKISANTLLYQFNILCSYGDKQGGGQQKVQAATLKADYSAFADCPATMSSDERDHPQDIPLIGYALGTKITFPNINDPSGLHNEGGPSNIPMEYEAFKIIAGNLGKQYSLNDVYNIFFTNPNGIDIRMTARSFSEGKEARYVIDANGTASAMTDENQHSFQAASYAPSLTQVFGVLTNTKYPFDLSRLIALRNHSGWNPTGQQYLYVNGQTVSGVNVPVTCDVLDASGKPVGLNIQSGVTVSCVATADTTAQKRFYLGGAPNPAFVSLMNKVNGQPIQSADQSQVYLQNINQDLGAGNKKCTAANQVSIYKYKSHSEFDKWMDGQPIKTICFDFSTIENPKQFSLPFFTDKTIGTSTFSSHVLAAQSADGSQDAVCIDQSAVTTTTQNGCLSSAGVFTVCADQNKCQCDWQSGSQPRQYTVLTAPSAGSVTLKSCGSGSQYYLSFQGQSMADSLSSLKVSLIDSSTGNGVMVHNTSYDSTILGKYIDAAFKACKASGMCWNQQDIKSLASASDIPARNAWMKQGIVQWYCGTKMNDATIQADCAKLQDSLPAAIPVSAFKNASDAAGSGVYYVYSDQAQFTNMQVTNPGYNRVFDYKTGKMVYANYDPYCDNLSGSGVCTYVPGATNNDIFFSDIWTFDPTYRLWTAVNGLSGYTYDSGKALFPADPTGNWTQDTFNSYINSVMMKVGGVSAIGCSNDRTIKLTWQSMQWGPNNTWRTSQPNACSSDSGYLVVRNIYPNDNSYFVSRPDLMTTLIRMAVGTANQQAIDPTVKQFDFVQAMALFMAAMNIPPVVVNSDGTYSPFYPTINGKVDKTIETGFEPTHYSGTLADVMKLFLAI